MQPMRRLIAVAAIAVALVPVAPAGAAATGTIEGRVVNGTTDEPQPDVEVTLTTGEGGGDSAETVITGPDGRYRFDDLPTGEDTFYVLDAVYEGGLFAGRPLTIPDDTDEPPVIETTLRVFEPTTDPNAILIRRNHLYLLHEEDRVTIVETVKVVNPTNDAYIGRGSELGAAGDEAIPSLGFALPSGTIPGSFQWVEADLDVPGAVELEGIGFGITPAIPPGEVDFTFSYQVGGEGGTFDLTRRTLYETSELSVFAAEPLEVTSNRLEQGDELDLEGTIYDRFTTTRVANAADPIQILVVAQGGSAVALVAGAAGGLVLLALLGFVAFRRTKRRAARVRVEDVPAPARDVPAPGRDGLVAAIAELDLRHAAGEVDDRNYAARRADLKQRLAGATGPGER